MNQPNTNAELSPWPHRWAWLLCGLTFPLLWVGQLVTTTDAGMAVPDWPNTYGYNMFLYPWQSWVLGPWDLFIEHGHRLLASLVGLVTICLLVVVWRNDSREWMLGLTVSALALVIFQGLLGGARVLGNERLIAMAHGCIGPTFFALTCVLVVLTSRGWQNQKPSADSSRLPTAAAFGFGLILLQLALGASLRHIDAAVGPWSFAALVKFHLLMAGVVLVATLTIGRKSRKLPVERRSARRIGLGLQLLVVTQIGLGVATWIAKYRAPGWAADWLPDNMGPIIAGGWSQTHTVTAHSAIGSLLLGLMAALAAWTWHVSPKEPPA